MSRLGFILAVLVVLPTAVLSLFAVRMLYNWETVLQARFEAGATRAVQEVGRRLSNDIETDWRNLRTAAADALAPRGRLRDVEAVLPEVMQGAPLVASIRIFMDPLGFVYPETDDAGVARLDLAQAWRQKLSVSAGVLSGDRPLLLRFGEDIYCFGPLGRGPGLYIGYLVCRNAYRQRLLKALHAVAGDDLVLSRASPAVDDRPVVVSDPFVPASGTLLSERLAPAGSAGVYLKLALPAPLDYEQIVVSRRDPDQAARTEAWRLRLYRWGVGLLLLCVGLGGWLTLRRTTVEVRRLRERSDMVMAMSHDLRTPITGMKMIAESLYLEHVSDPAKRREFLRVMIAETDRLTDMAERVLFFVRSERGALVHTMEWLDVGELAQSAVEIYRERLALSDGMPAASRMQLEVAVGLPEVRADRRALLAVLTNLIDNALTHGAPPPDAASRTPAVRVSVDQVIRRGRRRVCLAVRDFGPGIARHDQARVFRRFFRGPAANTPGSGLGLALCRDIVRAHGGRIEVVSEPGRGTEMRVLLPAGKESA